MQINRSVDQPRPTLHTSLLLPLIISISNPVSHVLLYSQHKKMSLVFTCGLLTSWWPCVRQGEPKWEDDGGQQDVRYPLSCSRWPAHVQRFRGFLFSLCTTHLQTHHCLRCQWLTCTHRRHAPLESEISLVRKMSTSRATFIFKCKRDNSFFKRVHVYWCTWCNLPHDEFEFYDVFLCFFIAKY